MRDAQVTAARAPVQEWETAPPSATPTPRDARHTMANPSKLARMKNSRPSRTPRKVRGRQRGVLDKRNLICRIFIPQERE